MLAMVQGRKNELGGSASAGAARRVWRRLSKPVGRRWRNRLASASRSTGPRRSTISALRSLGWASARAARSIWRTLEAFRGALEERTRERVPLHWAMTQYNLGTALAILGE